MLNATYEPLSVVPARRAVVLVLPERAEVVESNGHLPLRARHHRRAVGHTRCAATSRCGSTGAPPSTVGRCSSATTHLPVLRTARREPRPRGAPHQGGTHTWDNVVAACRRCNTRKGGRTPSRPACRSSGCPGHRAAAGRWRAARCPTPPAGSATWPVDPSSFPPLSGGVLPSACFPSLLRRRRRAGGEGRARGDPEPHSRARAAARIAHTLPLLPAAERAVTVRSPLTPPPSAVPLGLCWPPLSLRGGEETEVPARWPLFAVRWDPPRPPFSLRPVLRLPLPASGEWCHIPGGCEGGRVLTNGGEGSKWGAVDAMAFVEMA